MRYLPIELHTHTHHSDGRFTPAELLQAAAAYGYHGLVLTDHNTVSALPEIRELPGDTLPVLQGIEWTTYYGHLLVLGYDTVIDWRDAVIDALKARTRFTQAVKTFRDGPLREAMAEVADRIDALDGGAAAAQAGRFGCADRNGAGPGLRVDCGSGA